MDPLMLALAGVIVVVVVIMGPKKIPELARAIGQAKKEFNEGVHSPDGNGAPAAAAGSGGGGGDDLMAAAKKLGISTEGKTRDQISEEIVKKTAAS